MSEVVATFGATERWQERSRFGVTSLRAADKAAALELEPAEWLLASQLDHRVGELNLAADAAFLGGENRFRHLTARRADNRWLLPSRREITVTRVRSATRGAGASLSRCRANIQQVVNDEYDVLWPPAGSLFPWPRSACLSAARPVDRCAESSARSGRGHCATRMFRP
jgi:hypothetical protein